MAELPRVTVVTYVPKTALGVLVSAVVNNVETQLYEGDDPVDHHVMIDTYGAGELACAILGTERATTEWVVYRNLSEPMWFPTWLSAHVRWAVSQEESRAKPVELMLTRLTAIQRLSQSMDIPSDLLL